jgi:hypothetical protein
MLVGILQPSYLPWLGFFEQMARVDCFVLYDDVQYDKQGWRNRNRIKNREGIQWITVPILTKGKRSQLINQAQISLDTNWSIKHLASLETNYRNAGYFNDFFLKIEPLLKKQWQNLFDLNFELLNLLKEHLGIKTQLVLSSSLLKKLPKDASPESRLIEICEKVGGDTLYEGAAGQNYIDTRLFKKANIGIIYQQYDHPVYKQLYGDFVPYLSIVDLIFNEGPNSLSILELKNKGMTS